MNDNALKLYHRNVYWEDWFDDGALLLVSRTNALHPHLVDHLEQPNRQHNYTIQGLYLAVQNVLRHGVEPFEVGTDLSGNVLKAVVRTKYDEDRDISIVFRKDGSDYYIKTAWVNDRADNHMTLDENKYRRN